MNTSFRRPGGISFRLIASICILSLPPAQMFSARAQGDQSVTLEMGKTIERELSGGQSHSYQLALGAGQYLLVVVDQNGIDVVVALFTPDGKKLTQVDSPNGRKGPERLSVVIETAESYRLDVRSLEKRAPAGRYTVRIEELRAASAEDRALAESTRLLNESVALESEGKLGEAIKSAERGVTIREQTFGADHFRVAQALGLLASLYDLNGDSARAVSSYQRALAIREKQLGPDHLDTARSAHNLAMVHRGRGEYPQAEKLFLRALATFEKTAGADKFNIGQALDNLAGVYFEMGNYAKAEPLFQRALEIREETRGKESRDVAGSLNNLAMLNESLNQYEKAAQLHGRALAIKEKLFGSGHPEVAVTLNNLAKVCYNRGDYAEAGRHYERALAILDKRPGFADFDLPNSLIGLGRVRRREGDNAKAEIFLHRALAIREKTLEPAHWLVAQSLGDLSWLYRAKNDPRQAVSYLARSNEINERNISRNLLTGSERQKLVYLELFTRQNDSAISLHIQLAPDDPQALDLAFTTLLRRKGRTLDAVTDSVAQLRRHASAENQALFDQLAAARSQRAALMFRGPDAGGLASLRAQAEELEERMERLENEISSRSAEFKAQSQPVTLDNVRAAIPAGAALVEFGLYLPSEAQTSTFSPARYVAYALASGGSPRWVDLGEAARIDSDVDSLRRALRAPDRAEVKRIARRVDEKLMRPVRALLGETRRVFISPDGSLNLIPFTALVDERGRYLIERYSFSYLTSGRDLLRLQATAESKSPPMIVADPEFGAIASASKQSNQGLGLPANNELKTAALPDLSRVSFRPLPGTAGEAQALLRILPQARMLTKRQATETAIKQISSPNILHIATHGFFLKDVASAANNTRGLGLAEEGLAMISGEPSADNPLLRSGLVLAGANERGGGGDDGMLTALEVAGLDLWGTKLVVLSACNTGVGEVRPSEGVYGLRRALTLAGAETQVMSLWPVSDRGTRDLMIAYYRALARGEGRSEALRQVQLRMLRSKPRQHPYYWASFIQSGEWRNLDGN